MAMQYKGLTLDPFQEEAINAIEQNCSVVVSAPTGSGKTLTAEYIIDKHKDDGKRIIYTAPIKALSNQKYKDFSKAYGNSKVGLMTGDVVINPTAKILIMTTEIYRNMVLTSDESVADVAYVIFDEVHYINDRERGYVWEESIIYSPSTVRFLCLSATIPNGQEFADWISAIKKREVKMVSSEFRVVPLSHAFFDVELGITDLKSIKRRAEEDRKMPRYDDVFRKKGNRRRGYQRQRSRKLHAAEPNHVELVKELGEDKLPCLFFNFSRKACQQSAKQLFEAKVFKTNKEITQFVAKQVREWPKEVCQLPSTQLIRQTLSSGIGFHHAGLLPQVKELVEELFSQGLIKVLYTTETFAVGINMPAKTVCFAALRKYDGISFRNLNTKEYFQIAGRAGRRGIDKEGFVVSMIYRPTFKYYEVKKLTSKDVEPIKSQFKLSVNTVLNLLAQHSQEEIELILRQSFYSFQKYGDKFEEVPTDKLLFRYNRIVKKLGKFGFVDSNLKLTEKGEFSRRIFTDEMVFGEMFSTEKFKSLTEYQILLVLASLVYEKREKTKFKKKFPTKESNDLALILGENKLLAKERKFENIVEVTALVHPIYKGKSFFDVLQNTNLLEGDLIRFYGQILDRIGQIRKAGTSHDLLKVMDDMQALITRSMEGIYMF